MGMSTEMLLKDAKEGLADVPSDSSCRDVNKLLWNPAC